MFQPPTSFLPHVAGTPSYISPASGGDKRGGFMAGRKEWG
jgi:hypothetical protein